MTKRKLFLIAATGLMALLAVTAAAQVPPARRALPPLPPLPPMAPLTELPPLPPVFELPPILDLTSPFDPPLFDVFELIQPPMFDLLELVPPVALELDAMELLAQATPAPAAPHVYVPAPSPQPAQPPQAPNPRRDNASYERGMRALDERKWERAVEHFDEISQGRQSRRADGALYWKAYSLNKLGRRPEALAALDQLRKSYADSRWLNEAKALQAEIQRAGGQPPSPEQESDEELKLLALNSLLNSGALRGGDGADEARAVEMLAKFLQGNHSPRLKDRALFVLTQSRSPRAAQLIGQIAKGGSNPDLQLRAVHYLGIAGKEHRQLLGEIYASSKDEDVKRAILRSFMAGGERDRLLAAARSESDADLRREAIRLLGAMRARDEIWQLYQSESSTDVRAEMVRALFVAGDRDRMLEIARNEKDPKLRLEAVRHLGHMRGEVPADVLVSLYSADKAPEFRKEVIRALFHRSDCKTLVDVARKEPDAAMKREIIQHLSHMKCKEGTDFLMELLNK